jgi:hypothetical protein
MAKVVGTGNERYLMQTYYGDRWPYFPLPYVQQHGRPNHNTFRNFLNE